MKKIADTAELETELHQILAYAQSELPSRAKLASALYDLSQRVASKSYICVADLDRRGSPTHRNADSAEEAAEEVAKASHRESYVKGKRKGKDGHGDYEEFTVMLGSRAKGTVKVYEEYD